MEEQQRKRERKFSENLRICSHLVVSNSLRKKTEDRGKRRIQVSGWEGGENRVEIDGWEILESIWGHK